MSPGADESAYELLAGLATGATAMALPKWALIGLSHALEDEYMERGAWGVAIATFQRPRYYEQERDRWRLLAQRSELSLAAATFDFPLARADDPALVPIPRGSKLSHEWLVLLDSPEWSVCLCAREVGSQEVLQPDRRFDAIWTMESTAVRAVAKRLLKVADLGLPGLAARTPMRIVDRALPPVGLDREALERLSARFVDYVAAAAGEGGHRGLDEFASDWARASSHPHEDSRRSG